ncbi:MAG: PQQ-dependent sugar dehydrogenase [Planctomycetota bacterium]
MKAVLSLAGPLLLLAPLAAQTPLTYELVAEGLLDPLGVTAPPGESRVFIAEHGGVIKVAENGVVFPTPLLDLTAKVPPPPAGEAGFLGIAFHPNFADNGHFFVHYTDTNFDTVVERYTISDTDPNVADPASASLILFLPQPSGFHNGGGIVFGPDGYLYLGLGDGGAGLGPECVAQDPGNLFGTILRLDVDSASPYAIPPDNPFVGVPGAAEEIWHIGLRNPWRFTVDPENGDLFIGDVGAMTWEELDYAPGGVGGLNFGWPLNEADTCYPFSACAPEWPSCDDPSFEPPIFVVDHFEPPFACAMVGGEVYRGCALPELQGRYFFTDYCSSFIQSFQYDPVTGVSDLRDHTPELAAFGTSMFITSFGRDGNGELLFIYQATPDLDGKIYRIVPAQTPAGVVDCDGNGLDDNCEIAKQFFLDGDLDGVLDKCEELHVESAGISVSQGGQQDFYLHAGPAYANHLYLLAGSTSGTDGIPLGAVSIPLTFDVYTNFCINHPNDLPLQNNFGALSGAGTAQSTFVALPGILQPSLIGTKAYHAYAIADPFGTIVLASNYVPVRFTP